MNRSAVRSAVVAAGIALLTSAATLLAQPAAAADHVAAVTASCVDGAARFAVDLTGFPGDRDNRVTATDDAAVLVDTPFRGEYRRVWTLPGSVRHTFSVFVTSADDLDARRGFTQNRELHLGPCPAARPASPAAPAAPPPSAPPSGPSAAAPPAEPEPRGSVPGEPAGLRVGPATAAAGGGAGVRTDGRAAPTGPAPAAPVSSGPGTPAPVVPVVHTAPSTGPRADRLPPAPHDTGASLLAAEAATGAALDGGLTVLLTGLGAVVLLLLGRRGVRTVAGSSRLRAGRRRPRHALRS